MFGRKKNTVDTVTLAREAMTPRPTNSLKQYDEMMIEIVDRLDNEHDSLKQSLELEQERHEQAVADLRKAITDNRHTAEAVNAFLYKAREIRTYDDFVPPTPTPEPVKVHDPSLAAHVGSGAPACIACANGNDLSDGDECAACGRIGNVPPGASASAPEPIPTGFYYDPEGGDFYDASHKRQDFEFFSKWNERADEFPTEGDLRG